LLPAEQIAADLARYRIWVEKTGGPREHEALAFLSDHLARRGVAT